MTLKYHFTATAEKDLTNILDYLENKFNSPRAASNFLKTLQVTVNQICNFPYSFPKITNKYIKNIEIRKSLIKNYILYYTISNDNSAIIIVRFSHSTKDELNFLKSINNI